MKRLWLPVLGMFAMVCSTYAQGDMDAMKIASPDLRGTARYMSMGGAFGALGGDITTLSQNPAGIGVYRSSEVATTLNFSVYQTKSSTKSAGMLKDDNFKFSFDNIGYVGTFNLTSGSLRNFNFGFAYNRQKTFDRTFRTGYNNLSSSMTNYMAAVTNGTRLIDLAFDTDRPNYDPYYNNQTFVPWLGILGYSSYLIEPDKDTDANDLYHGFFNPRTDKANASAYSNERGRLDEYTFNFGGNVSDKFYFGLGIGVIDLSYQLRSSYREDIKWTSVDQNGNPNAPLGENGYFDLNNTLSTNGTGVNFKMGAIFRPSSSLRLGFAFHTPTFYNITDRYSASVDVYNIGGSSSTIVERVSTPSDNSRYDLRSPWRVIASIAGVIGKSAIVSFDYEYSGYQNMQFSDNEYGTEVYADVNRYINEDFKAGHTFRVGAEYRLTNQWSVRAGYAKMLSPITANVKAGDVEIMTPGTRTQYCLDKGTDFYTAGLGYRYANFYVDAAFVYKQNKSDFYAFSPVFGSTEVLPQKSDLDTNRKSFLFTFGFKF